MAAENEQFFDWLCRTCMQQLAESSGADQEWQSIYDTIEEFGTQEIAQLLTITIPQIVEVQQNDELPKKICSKCFEKLLIVHRFQEQCKQTDQKLRQMVAKSNLKIAAAQSSLEEEIDTKDLVVAKESLMLVNEDRVAFESIAEKQEASADPLQSLSEVVKNEICEEQFCEYNDAEAMLSTACEQYTVLELEAGEEQFSSFNGQAQRAHNDKRDKQKVCDICNKILASTFSLNRHKRAHHPLEYSNEQDIARSKRSISGSKPSNIHAESQQFRAESDVDSDSRNGVYNADKTIHTTTIAEENIESIEEKDKEPTSLIDAQAQIVRNERNTENDTRHVCDICNKSLASTFSLNRHKRAYHPMEYSNEQATRTKRSTSSFKPQSIYADSELCSEESDSNGDSLNDVYSADNTNNRKTKTVKNVVSIVENDTEQLSLIDAQGHIVQNERNTENDTRHVCDICNKSLASTFSLNRHKRAYHPTETTKIPKASDVNLFANESCGDVSNAGFGEVSTIEGRNTQRISPAYKRPLAVCDICDKVLSCQFALNRHKRTCHTNENPNETVHPVDHPPKVLANEPCDDTDESNVECSDDETMHSMVSAENEEKAEKLSRQKVCNICKKTLASAYSLKRHKLIYHSTENEREPVNQLPLKVPANNEMMMTVENDVGGIIANEPCTEEMQPTCSANNDELTTKIEVEQINLAFEETQELYDEKIYKKIPQTCDECKKPLSSMYSLKRHKRIYHSTETPVKKISLWYTKDRGTQRVRFRKPTQKCDICKKILSSKYALKRHNEIHHATENSNNTRKKYQCETCNKVFKTPLLLSNHSQNQTCVQTHLCDVCGKAFKQAGLLEKHMFRHSDNRTFECPHCPSKFRCPNDVAKHQKIHNGIRRHICDVCGASFNRTETLKFHKRYHTNEKPYQCEFCKHRFHRSVALRRHMLTHTGERPYKCKYCKRTFTQSNERVKHLRIHLGENVYGCKLCPLRFRLASDMRLHYATHKNEDIETRERNMKALREAEAELQAKLAESTVELQ